MKTYKAFIKLNGEIGDKEIPSIEYIDNKYLKELDARKKSFLDMLENIKPENASSSNIETNLIWHDPVIVHQQILRLENDEDTRQGVKQAFKTINDITKVNRKINLLMDFLKLDIKEAYNMSAHRIWAVGFKENEEIPRRIMKIAILGNDSPTFRAEKELMESEMHRFFTGFHDALNWLKMST